MVIFNVINYLEEFEKDLKKLNKRFKTLDSDMENFIKTQLRLYHKLNIDNGGILKISGLSIKSPQIFKARKFACKALKGTGSKSGIRIIYGYYNKGDKIEFIEVYYKGDKENEDRERILKKYG